MEGFARALAREKLLARPRKLLVLDDRTGLLSSPGSTQGIKRERVLLVRRFIFYN